MTTDRNIRFLNVLVQGGKPKDDEMHDLTNESFSFSTDSIIKAGSTEITNTPLFSLNSNSTTYAKIDALRKQAIALVCPQCTKTTSLNDQLLKCNKCYALVHFACSKLPSYCFGLLKPLNGLYVCETCVARCQDEVDKRLESVEQCWTVKTSIDDRTFQDIHFSLNEITDEIEKPSIASKTHSVLNIDDRIAKLEAKMEEKLRKYLNGIFAKYSEDMMEKFTLYYKHSQHMTEKGTTPNYNDCKSCMQTEELNNKDMLIERLKTEIIEKNKNIEMLGKKGEELFEKNGRRSEDLFRLNNEIENFKQHPRSSYVDQLKEYIKILELQIIVNNGQNEILAVTGQQKDSKLLELRNQIRNMGTRLGKAVEQSATKPDGLLVNQAKSSDIGLPQPHIVVNQSRLPVPPQAQTNQVKLKSPCNVTPETYRQRNSIQPHVVAGGSSYNFKNSSTTKPMEKPRLENVMLFDGSLYQRVGHVQG